MAILSADVQNRWKDSYASSPQVKLTVRANSEEKTQLITPQGLLVRAGFDAPTVAPTCAAGTSGSLTSGKFVAYRYVYASSRYPFVDNVVTGGDGMLYPRSNPSPASSVFTVTATGAVTLTVTKTTRSDVDLIWVYRTAQADTTEEAQALADAGQMYYVGSVGNNSIAGTTTFTDTSATDTGELLELDNYPAPTFAYVVFDGVQWWGFGNPEFEADVTLDSTSTVTLSGDDRWFDGRDGQVCTFDGITSGGFDARGSFYFKRLTDQTAQMSLDEEGTQAIAVRATGTTKIHVRGPATTIYRSKPRNPFSWGWTELIYESGSQVRVPQLFASKVGGGIGTSMAFIADDRRLKVDTEAPAATYTFDLNAADDFKTFEQSKQTVDGKFSVSSHFSQFLATMPEGQSVLMGLDVKNFAILQSDGDSQIPVSSPVFQTLRQLKQSGTDSHFFHGVYDPRTELNCFWVKTAETHAVDEEISGPNLLIAYHAPTGQWSLSFDPEITASASVYDPIEKQTITLVGSEAGHIGRAFAPDVYANWTQNGASGEAAGSSTEGPSAVQTAKVVFPPDSNGSLDGKWFKISVGDERIGFWFNINNSGTAMPADLSDCTSTIRLTTTTDGDDDYTIPLNATAYEIARSLEGVTTSLSVDTSTGDGEVFIVSRDAGPPVVYGTKSVIVNDGDTGATVTQYQSVLHDSAFFARSDVWGLLTSDEGNPLYWFRYIKTVNDVAIVERWLEVGGDQATRNTPNITGAVRYFVGVTPVRVRRYFDLQQPTKAKKSQELWLTAQNVYAFTDGMSPQLTVAWFKEYSDTEFSRFSPSRDKIAGSTTADSVNWLSKTAVPSLLLNQFGVEVTECGYDAFRLQTLHIKTNG